MSQVFENREVDVQLIRPTVNDKQQPYWTWGDNVENSEDIVELFGDEAEEKTRPFVEQTDDEFDETATLLSSSKDKVPSTELRTLKREFERTKDELAKVASSNRALRNKVHDLEKMVRKDKLKHEEEREKIKNCVEDFGKTLASMEHYFMVEIEQLKTRNGGFNERGEGHEEVGSPHMNEGGDNYMSPLHEYVTPMTQLPAMEAQVPDDGDEACAAMEVQEAEMAALIPHIQVQQEADQPQFEKPQSEELPTAKNVDGGEMIPHIIPNVIVRGDDEGSGSVQTDVVEGKRCRKKQPAQTLLSPFTDPSKKKRVMTGSDEEATLPCFDPTKPLPIEDVKAVLEFCTRWKNDISAEVQLESSAVGPYFFYKLVDDMEWISSRCGHNLYFNFQHLDMAMFLIRKRQLSHPSIFGSDWTIADYCLQQFLEPVKAPPKKQRSRKATAPKTVDLPPSYEKKIHHFVHGSYWVAIELDFVRHTVTVYDSCISFTSKSKLVKFLKPISKTLARVLYEMRFYEDSEVEEVKQKGMTMLTFTPFSVCSIGDVPQQRDGAACGIMTVKFIEHLSGDISLDKVDPSKTKYYRLKLAIECLRGKAYI
ncbi:unnamed protein product [Prunus armeniaca]